MGDWGDDELEAIDVEADESAETPDLCFANVNEFVRDYLRVVYARPINGRNRCWAGRWWQHDAAVVRLEVLWRAWEHLRQDPATGISVCFRDHADHHMSYLMDPDGPFSPATEGAESTNRRARRPRR